MRFNEQTDCPLHGIKGIGKTIPECGSDCPARNIGASEMVGAPGIDRQLLGATRFKIACAFPCLDDAKVCEVAQSITIFAQHHLGAGKQESSYRNALIEISKHKEHGSSYGSGFDYSYCARIAQKALSKIEGGN